MLVWFDSPLEKSKGDSGGGGAALDGGKKFLSAFLRFKKSRRCGL